MVIKQGDMSSQVDKVMQIYLVLKVSCYQLTILSQVKLLRHEIS